GSRCCGAGVLSFANAGSKTVISNAPGRKCLIFNFVVKLHKFDCLLRHQFVQCSKSKQKDVFLFQFGNAGMQPDIAAYKKHPQAGIFSARQ
ncbi:hypothetical protein, partial [Undibacterium luofuense]|uniref:hypothetical protein n=1 Tax=Undibacterium luofuense TaxID=2828733 RepID=UPI0030EC8F2D